MSTSGTLQVLLRSFELLKQRGYKPLGSSAPEGTSLSEALSIETAPVLSELLRAVEAVEAALDDFWPGKYGSVPLAKLEAFDKDESKPVEDVWLVLGGATGLLLGKLQQMTTSRTKP